MNHYTYFYFFLMSAISPVILSAQSFKVMTFNIRYDETRDSMDNWHFRKREMIELFKKEQPVLIGIQEGLYHQVTYIDSCLSDYMFVGKGRDDGNMKGEYSAIFIDTTQFKLVHSSTFWLSETPDTISKGWDAALPRICTYALLEHKKNNRFFWIFNTHFDHIGEIARAKSSELIVKKIKMLNTSNYPIILMGDMNSNPNDIPIKILSEKYYDVRNSKNFKGPEGTFNGFGKEKAVRRIDYIFLLKFETQKAQHLESKRRNGRHISDHLPVMVKIKFASNSAD